MTNFMVIAAKIHSGVDKSCVSEESVNESLDLYGCSFAYHRNIESYHNVLLK